jgi:hypothetical protein
VLYVVLLMGSTSTGSDAQIIIALELIAILLFLPFLGYLYSVLRRAEGEGAWLAPTAVATVVLKTRVLPLWLGLLAAITAPTCLVNGMFLDAEFGPAFLLFLLWVTIASIVLTLRAGRATVKAAASSKAAWPEPSR